MRNSVILILKPKQLFKLFLVVVCLITLLGVVRDNINPPRVNSLPHSVPPEIERGEFLAWEAVDQIFRRYTNATVIDVDTGLSFQVQRRGGTYHADVQPLTAHDTAIMKIIYNGTWSWQRKAIVVKLGSQRIAASMNGMPHGAGAIRGNDFKGHFCIHFRDSKVHQSGKENLAHQMMIWKAAGKFQQMITAMSPEEVIVVLMNALDQQDAGLALKTLYKPSEKQRADIEAMLQQLTHIRVQRIRSEGGNPQTFWVYLSLQYRGGNRDVEKKIELQVMDQGEAGWRIIGDGLQEILNRKTSVEIFDVRIFDDGDQCN